MSAEYDDVLTNQPVVIDNVRRTLSLQLPHFMLTAPSLGLWDDQSWLCRARSSEMFLSIIVRRLIIAW